LFYLPVTKAWLQQVMLGLVLLCHSSFQGVVEFFRDVLDCPVALGSVHNGLMQAVAQARQLNAVEELSAVRAAGHDGIFQSGQKVAVGVELDLHVIGTDDRRSPDLNWSARATSIQSDIKLLNTACCDQTPRSGYCPD
jgi:hypothetical protein